jgi:hypothetical protein
VLVLLAPALRIAVRCAHAGERVYLSPCLRVWVGHALRMHGSCFVNAGSWGAGGNVCITLLASGCVSWVCFMLREIKGEVGVFV